MQHTPHVLLGGEGAGQFANQQGLAACDPASSSTRAQ
jgi:isoaspartyl peptidase/L-asparaginase-like protein (Ntn-hydrolase superfamily)